MPKLRLRRRQHAMERIQGLLNAIERRDRVRHVLCAGIERPELLR
jgi:hypothetical protein